MGIDDIAGIAVFIIFVVVALVRKFAEQREIETQQKNVGKPSPPAQMPEATRRMLYGDNAPTAPPRLEPKPGERGPVVAKPRGQLNVPTAQPRRVVPPPVAPKQAQPRPVQPVARAPQPSPQRPVSPPRPQEVQAAGTPFRPTEEQRRLSPDQQRHIAQEERHRLSTDQQRHIAQEEQRRLTPEQRRPQQRRKAPPPIVTEGREGPAPTPQPGRRVQPARHAGRRRLIAGAHDLRRAIILREVLGPPKAFE